jgi:Nucleotide-diphospho-sugar transferase
VCVATYGHIVNDAFDVEADLRANKPNAMSNLSVGARILLALLFFVGGFLPASVANYSYLTLALLAANYLWPTLYSIPGIRLKERGLLGVMCDAMGSHITPTLLILSVFDLVSADSSIGLWIFGGAATLWAAVLGIKGILHHQIYDRVNDIESGTVTLATVVGPARIIRFLTWFNITVELPVSAGFAATVLYPCPFAAAALAIYVSTQTLRYRLGERLTMASDAQMTRAIVPFTNELFYTLWLPMAAALQLAVAGAGFWWLPVVQAGAFYKNLSAERAELTSIAQALLRRWRRSHASAGMPPETTGWSDRNIEAAMSDDWTIVLFATAGLSRFVENALIGILQCRIDAGIVQLVYPESARNELDPVAEKYRVRSRILEETIGVDAPDLPSSYVEWNTEAFNILMSYRFRVLRAILAEGKKVVVSDIDVAWLRNPLPYLSEVLRRYPWACQVEAKVEFPPNFCLGFYALRAAPDTIELIELNLTLMGARDVKPADQALFREILIDNPRFLAKVFALPESAFPSGLLYRSVASQDDSVPIAGRMQPFIFHANWCVGLENKQRLLAHAGAWFVPDDPKRNPLARLNRLMRDVGFLGPAATDSHDGPEHIVELKMPGFHGYKIPPGTRRIRIISDPVLLPPDSRMLGAAITDLWIGGSPLALSDARLVSGFHLTESDGEHTWRWTDGAAVVSLPLKSVDVQFDVNALFIASSMLAKNP